MRVLIVGESHPHRLGMSYVRGFRSLGAVVELFDYYARIALGAAHPGVNMLAAPALRVPAAAALVRTAALFRPDLVLFLKADDLPAATYRALRLALPRRSVLAAFHPDDPTNVRTLLRRGPSHKRALVQARRVDRYFLWSKPLIAKLSAMGIRADYLAFASDPQIFRAAGDESPHVRALAGRFDVAFVGNWDERREGWLEPLARSGLRLGIWGATYWNTRCRSETLRQAWQGEEASPEVFAAICRAVPVSLNLLRAQNVGAHNMRTFEIPACGGVMLAEWSEDQAQYFPEGQEAFYVRAPDEMPAEARRIASLDGGARARIAARAVEKALQNTYRSRAEQVCAACGFATTGP